MILTHFASELEKLAVDVADLYDKVRRAKHVHFDEPSPVQGHNIVAQTQPTRRQVSASQAKALDGLEATINAMPDNDFISKADLLKSSRSLTPVVNRQMKDHMKSTNAYGRIDLNQKAITQVVGSVGKAPEEGSHAARALTALAGAHELFERKTGTKDIVGGMQGHMSPDVLFKEHNLLSRLTGEGSDHARSLLRSMRVATGESGHVRGMVDEAFGHDPRAQQFLEEGTKIPKAMRKALLRKVRVDPGIIERARPDFVALLHKIRTSPLAEMAERRVKP